MLQTETKMLQKNVLTAGLKQLSDTVGRTEIEQEQVLLNNASGENDLCLVVW